MPGTALWETEDEMDGPLMAAAAALPTPTDTPYRTPSRDSRRSRRSATPPRSGNSPPPLPGIDKIEKASKNSKRSSKDLATDESISIFDPRRFTPTLHANLVSEILALRRDQEEKVKIIEGLETALQSTREEQETLQESAVITAKENRSLRRQLALVEGDTSSALGELTRERREAVDLAGETKKRLEVAQKRLRHYEEDSARTHDQWAKEKEVWEDEKRKLERKLHVADSRLKSVLEEVAAFHAAQVAGANGHSSDGDELDDATAVARDIDTASIRTMSMTNSIRFSVPPGKLNGNSLADELDLNGDETDEADNGGRDSVFSNSLHDRSHSRDSNYSRTHRRQQSNESLRRPGSVSHVRFLNQSVLDRLEGVTIEEADEEQALLAPSTAKPKVEYTDSAVQYSPPPSPKIAAKASIPEPIPTVELHQPPPPPQGPYRGDRSSLHDSIDSTSRSEWGEIEANQSRKRVHIARPVTIELVSVPAKHMMSTGSQTLVEEPTSPRTSLKSSHLDKEQRSLSHAAVTKPTPPAMQSRETQTDPPTPPASPVPVLAADEDGPLLQMLIPSISIHPPTSRPTTPREHRLPPLVKDFGCQVEISLPTQSKSVSVQTDEIRVDKRLGRLPPHLHPSAITSRPSSPAAIISDPVAAAVDDLSGQTFAPAVLPPRNPRRLVSRSSTPSEPPSPPQDRKPATSSNEETHDAYPGNNDDGPLSSQKAPMRRPHRISSLFAGFDGGSSDEVDEFADADMSDSEYRTALSAPKPRPGSSSRAGNKRHPAVSSEAASPDSYLHRSSVRNSLRLLASITSSEIYSKYALADVPKSVQDISAARMPPSKGSRMSLNKGGSSVPGASGKKTGAMRKAAMIQNGIASHQGRPRSPSLPDARDPPFPIPTRASSRKVPTSISAPSDGRRSPTRAKEAWHRRGSSRSHYRTNSIRKVRSAAAIPVKPRRRGERSRSPPLHSGSFLDDEDPESPDLPPLPTNDITAPRFSSSGGSRYKPPHHQHQASTNTAVSDQPNAGSVNSSNQATGVVDAIAQTMVGEWMYKYVRRRKSFGAAETTGRDDSSNDRHKRWVWLAPYERAILWSSKQPSNNSMLMGKSGRKLTIQSVLDVKDDNPPPKGCGQLFNRSILILTPQRALKFTATTPERHYVWLTSLSFLAHSQQAVPENITVPPVPPVPTKPAIPEYELQKTKPRKGGIRDSIRLTKNKTAMLSGSSVAVRRPPPPMSTTSSHIDSLPPSIPSYRPAESYVSAPSVTYTSAPSVAATSSTHQRDTSRDTAEPPVIASYYDRGAMVHGRKRSNTGGHVPPPLSFRGFSGPAGSSTSYYHASSNSTAANSDVSQSQASSWGFPGGLSSQRTSEASSRPSGAVMNNFFDAIGTVRMEAFISPLAMSQFDEYPDEQEEMRYRARRRSKEIRRRASRSRHRDSYNSRTTRTTDDYYAGSRTGGEEDYFRDDPFKGF
ncbi:hypothetical protein SEPCBS119000_003353 [Sporothrix epigloea]|uniref:Pleckstrin homology domain-containing protein n=1 Tax=Sporothrix epigloea TaxID=1892477 RepID=A0ABP0DL93_9PEZI